MGVSSQAAGRKMRQRSSWSWSRPTPHVYAYNREYSKLSAASEATSRAETSRRSTRATSVLATEESSALARSSRAMSVDTFKGYTGFYGRQLARMSSSASASASASASSSSARSAAVSAARSSVAAVSSSSSAMSMSASKSVSQVEQSKTTTSIEASKKMNLLSEQAKSLDYGRRSMSKAVRRAEIHAVNSGKDPRHVPVPRNISDDICYTVADLHISPYVGKEITGANAATQQGKLKVERMDGELSQLTVSALSYKTLYAKSASQMASEAYAAMESEAASSKKTKKTIVTTSSKMVAAA